MSKPTWDDVRRMKRTEHTLVGNQVEVLALNSDGDVYLVPATIYEALLRLANEVRQFRISPIGDDFDDIARATVMIERSDDALSEFGPLPEVSDE